MAMPQLPPEKHAGGRPLKYKTVKELENAVADYFTMCDNHIKEVHTKEGEAIGISDPLPYTMAGLALSIGMDRRTLLDYQKRDKFLPTLKEARSKVESDVELRLMNGAGAGAIFSLKNNFGWRDKTEIDHTTKNQPIPLLAGIAPTKLEVDNAGTGTDDRPKQD